MAKIHYISDLHDDAWNCYNRQYSILSDIMREANFIVIAGDVANGVYESAKVINRLFESYNFVNPNGVMIVVKGNHDLYHWNVLTPLPILKHPNLVCLDGHMYASDVHGIVFLGDTLWTDYLLNGKAAKKIAQEKANTHMSDHRLIRTNENYGLGFFSSYDAANLHRKQKNRLTKLYRYIMSMDRYKDCKKVLVTHHGVTEQSIHETYKEEPYRDLNPCFSSYLSEWEVFKGVDLCIHGHVHNSFDYVYNDTRVVVNPLGYPQRGGYLENENFNPHVIIEI